MTRAATWPVRRHVQAVPCAGAAVDGLQMQIPIQMQMQMQYREAGDPQAPLLVLLHPSPRNSAMFEPWMQMLAPHFHVVAIDTPGYGGSSPLPQRPTQLSDYLGPLHALIQALMPLRTHATTHVTTLASTDAPTQAKTENGNKFMLYGSATGAQLGIAYAKAYPQQLRHLMLDNAAHFDDGERERILAHYFPDLSPRDDGSHLQTMWRMATQMHKFFPWFAADEAHRISHRAPSAAEVHATVADFLAAGPDYPAAYRAAFEHERAEHVQALTVPATVLRWQGSILLRHIDRLLAHPLPPQVQVLQTPAAADQRHAVMTQHLLSLR